MKAYFRHTANPLFGIVVIIPLALYYEISMVLSHRGMQGELRNAADVMFKRLFGSIGFDGPLAGILLFLCFFIIAAVLQGVHRERTGVHIRWKYYPLMALESLVYAGLLYALMAVSMNLLSAPALAISPVDIAYSLGAGVYEELLFRAILLQALLLLAEKLPGKVHLWKAGMLVLTALLFSGAHYLGVAGDSFSWLSFMARSLGGILLGLVYMFRGLGPAVYTHAIYDIFTLI
jgi:hypothetical protein